MRDTSQKALDRYHELLREQSPQQKLEQVNALTRMVRQMATAGIRERFPDASEEEVRIRLAVRLYGQEIARRLFGDRVPDDAI